MRRVKYYTSIPEPFPEIVITFQIRRKTLYYMYNIVFPCMMMSTLTVLVFCLPPDSGEKIALGVTVLLAFSVFMLAIAEKMPETSESIPLIGKTKVPKQKGWKLLPKIPFLQYNKNETFWEIFKHCAQVYLSF